MITCKHERLVQPTTAYRVRVVDGPDSGKECRIDPQVHSRVLVGTGAGCDLQTTDEHMSRRHVALEPMFEMLRVTDLGSTNGTFLNGTLVVDAFARGDEILQCGATRLRIERAENVSEIEAAEEEHFGRTLGRSLAMRRLFVTCARLAASRVPVVIEGPIGSGKELLAECLHEEGERASKPFVVFDSSPIAKGDVDVALFGAEPNAGMNAQRRVGLFEQANDGTLLLSEPADIPLDVQRKLVRAVERGEIWPIGAHAPRVVDVRIISTSTSDLDRAVEQGRLREDLYFRLAIARIELPPLARRKEDIPLLAEHFWVTLGGGTNRMPPTLLSHYELHDWPGNVRELQNTIARHLSTGQASSPLAYVAKAGDVAGAAAETPGIPSLFETVLSQNLPIAQARQLIVVEFERHYVAHVLARHNGNVSRAAQASGLARRYFQLLKARHAAAKE